MSAAIKKGGASAAVPRAALGEITSNAAPLASSSAPASKAGKSVEQIYQKKTQLEHILLRPDSYVGSVQKHTGPMWVWDAASRRVVSQTISYCPALYKIFDEILVNAADNKQRDKAMNTLKVTVDPATNLISVWNNGTSQA